MSCCRTKCCQSHKITVYTTSAMVGPTRAGPLFPLPLLRPRDLGWLVWCCREGTVLLARTRGGAGTSGNTLMTVPMALVLPSLNTILVPMRRNSGFLMNWNRQIALSPVRRLSLSIEMMEAVCRVHPQCTDMVGGGRWYGHIQHQCMHHGIDAG